jgi:hypothetical protein
VTHDDAYRAGYSCGVIAGTGSWRTLAEALAHHVQLMTADDEAVVEVALGMKETAEAQERLLSEAGQAEALMLWHLDAIAESK